MLRVPHATYRLQFNEAFGFQHARHIVPYLDRLGISDLYASPILRPRRGSTHGYDGIDPSQLNPELGAAMDFEALSTALQAHAMGLLVDIVPNHMAASPQNPWWSDVLEKGSASRYATFFDIDWHPPRPAVDNKLLLPILGRPYGEALEARELQLRLEADGIYLNYYETRLPLAMRSWAMLAAHRLDEALARQDAAISDFARLQAILQTIDDLPSEPLAARIESLKVALLEVIRASAAVNAHVVDNIAIFNGATGDPSSFDRLDALLGQQAYQLAFWQTSTARINYRRFFDIGDLVGIRTEEAQVFEAVHALVLRLIQENKVTGLRLDHIDGLYDPLAYLQRLQSQSLAAIGASGEQPFYVVAEKILTGEETLLDAWPIAGTTGYDFLNVLNRVFVDPKGFEELRAGYQQLIASDQAFHDMVYDKKKHVMSDLFAGEVTSLTHALARLAQHDRYALDLPLDQLKLALLEVTACLPVYRTYIDRQGVTASDQQLIETAISHAQGRNPSLDARAWHFFQRVACLQYPASCSADQQVEWRAFVWRWQQFTGPVMAKGVEDTALYNYNCLISLNDVGGEPDLTGDPVEAFHRFHQARLARWPHTLNATSTHDTKRSEDVRARINVLSEMPQVWHNHLQQWRRWHDDRKRVIDASPVPDANTELLLYQTLLGTWPLSDADVPQLHERLQAFTVKAAREAKVLSNWLSPQPANEAALHAFVDALLEPVATNQFLTDFLPFEQRIAFYGAINSLSQVLLKIVSPGVPDFYQGTELWDLSMVDPDNRRPVDFTHRLALLDRLLTAEQHNWHALLDDLLQSWHDGRVKLYVTHKALHARNAQSHVFLQGCYTPLRATGAKRDHVMALARHHDDTWMIAVVPRLPSRLSEAGTFPLGDGVWETDELVLPHDAPGRWANVLTGESLMRSASGGLRLAELLLRFPVALLMGST